MPDIKDLPPFLSRQQVAPYLGVSLSTVARIIRDGALPVVRVRGQVRISREALADYLRRNGG